MRLLVLAGVVACAQQPPSGPTIASHVETFEIPGEPPPKLDILFVLDDTAASAPFAARTAEMLRSLDNTWTGGFPTPDLHVAVATADPADAGTLHVAPVVHGPFAVDTHRPDYRARTTNFDGSLGDAAAALGDVGTAGSATAPLDAIATAVPSDFLRSDALFAVVIVSASDDASPSDPVALAQQLRGLKTDSDGVAVIGIYPTGSPRLDAFVGQFPNRSTTTPIDAASYVGSLALIAQLYKIELGLPCIGEPLAVDGHYDCSLELVEEDGVVEPVPACPSGDRCWTFHADPVYCPSAPGGQFQITSFAYPIMPTLRGQCVVAD